MSSSSDRVSADDVFSQIEAKLALIRADATAPPDAPESWLKRTFSPAVPSSRQSDFNLAIVDALSAAVTALRETVASQAIRLEQLERDLTEMRSLSGNVRELQERSASAGMELAQMRQGHGELRERSAAAETRLTQLTQLGEKIDQLSSGQDVLGGELRERIQHLLDEQRVCLRQLSLKTSEDAVLAERARRATELRLEEFARRIPERPA
jgi:hypothetical protein